VSEPTFRPDRLVAAGEANDASGQRNGSTQQHRWHTQTLLGGDDVPEEERGDCVRAAMTSILGLPIDAAPNFQGSNWWGSWQEFVAGYGFELLVIWPKQMPYPPAGLWLCVVPSLVMNGNHCVVARGKELVHDPAMKRRYTADEWNELWADEYRVLEGWLLAPLDPAKAVAA